MRSAATTIAPVYNGEVPEEDPDELLDVCDHAGNPVGRTKGRGAVHRDGDWHRSVHLWVVLGSGEVVLQRRGLSKASHPGKVDVAVAGHLAAGEGVAAILREAREEAGLEVTMDSLVYLGRRRKVDATARGRDRELQDVFLACVEVSLESFRPEPGEVEGLLALDRGAALALVVGEASSAAARERKAGHSSIEVVRITRADLLPSTDGYFAAVLGALVRGERMGQLLGG